MLGSWPVVLALLLAPTSADPASSPEHDPSCEVWIYDAEHWPKLEPTDECPSWTVNVWHVEPFDAEDDVLLVSRWSPKRHRHAALLTRDSFFEVMVQQAAGVLINPIAPRPRAAPLGCS